MRPAVKTVFSNVFPFSVAKRGRRKYKVKDRRKEGLMG